MNVALVHELLTRKGGAERMLRILADMYPNAPIYTLLYDEKVLGDWFPKERVRTSTLQKYTTHYSLLTTHSFNHHLYLPFFPRAVEAWPFDMAPAFAKASAGKQGDIPYDLVISSSSAFVHGIITNGKPKHLCYVQSPARYLWDRTHEIMEGPTYAISRRQGYGRQEASVGKFAPLRSLRRFCLSCLFHRLRIWDAESADRPDVLLAASKAVQRRIELYWRRESTVLYPSIDDCWFQNTTTNYKLSVRPRPGGQPTTSPYFLIVSQLAPYKRIDLAIEACNQLRLPLKISGSGPDRKRLERLAGPTVAFLGYVPEEELRDLYRGAAATIFPGEEDFGLVPLESMACGTPVIAFRGGGALETVQEGVTGAFFNAPASASLTETLRHFDRSRFPTEACRAQAQRFSREAFEQGIREAVEALIL